MLIVTSPGPNLFLLLRTTPSRGVSAGMATTLGFAAAIMTHAFLSVLGVGAVMLSSPLGFAMLKLLGAVYLSWLGIKALRAAWGSRAIALGEPGDAVSRHTSVAALRASFGEGFLTNALNPKPALFYLAIFPQFLENPGAPLLVQGSLLGAVHAVLAIGWYGLVVVGLSRISGWISSQPVWQTIQGLSGVALVYLGFRLLTLRNEGSG